MEITMQNDTILSRRRLLARAPAVAAAVVPATATALPGFATPVPDHLDAQGVEGLAEMLEGLEKLPKDEANTVLNAITECSNAPWTITPMTPSFWHSGRSSMKH
jgi:hypothetical protein